MILLEQFFRMHRVKRAAAAAAENEEQYDCNQNANGNEWRARADGSANIRKTGFFRVFLRRGGNDSGIRHRGKIVADRRAGKNGARQHRRICTEQNTGRIQDKAHGRDRPEAGTGRHSEHACEDEGGNGKYGTAHVQLDAQPDQTFNDVPAFENVSVDTDHQPKHDGGDADL